MHWLTADRGDRLPLDDRGLAYGDGLFETLKSCDGQIHRLDAHLGRLQRGCAALRLANVRLPETRARLQRFAAQRRDADWIKLIVTRGSGARGYAPPAHATPTAVLSSGALSPAPDCWHARVCDTRLPDAGQLAGLKHLNRLPQVLARTELAHDEQEGLMRDTGGDIACGIMSNVFVVIGKQVRTPDLSRAGVAGVMRDAVCRATHVIPGRISRGALHRASEVFVTNALRGVVSLARVDGRTLPSATPVADALRRQLAAGAPC